tara:strand:+ start:931 stop:1680 length:750 start_codon:yes stop_codon:yes gene_type:complete
MSVAKSVLDLKSNLDKDGVRFLLDNDLMKSCLRETIINAVTKSISLSSADKEVAINAFMERNNIRDKSELDQYIVESGCEYNFIEARILKPVKIRGLANKLFENQANKRFIERKDDLELVVYSIIRTKQKELALELYLKIDSNEVEFSTLAAEYSEGPERITRGLIGPVPFSQVNQILMNKLRLLSKGELLEPFNLEGWWILLRLDNLITPEFTESIRTQMNLELLDEYLDCETNKNLEALRKYAFGGK